MTTALLHDWAKEAIEMQTICFMHNVMCIGVHEPFIICEMARKLGYEGQIGFIADCDTSTTKCLKKSHRVFRTE
jgi:peroxiredoxin